jgi:hypothetical protein
MPFGQLFVGELMEVIVSQVIAYLNEEVDPLLESLVMED